MSTGSESCVCCYLGLVRISDPIMQVQHLRFLMILIMLWLVNMECTAQTDWPLDKRRFQLVLSEWWTVSDQHYNADGEIADNVAEYGFFATTLALRYGLSDRFMLSMRYPIANYVYTKLPLSGSKSSGWKEGDIETGIQYALLRKSNFNLSTQFAFSLPTSGVIGSQATGDPGSYQQLSVSLIRKLALLDLNGWWQVGTGYRNRNAGFDNELHYHVGLGLAIDSNFIASMRLHGFTPMGSIESTSGVFSESLFSNQREAHMLSPEIQFRISERIALGVGVDLLLGGRNRFAESGYLINFTFRR